MFLFASPADGGLVTSVALWASQIGKPFLRVIGVISSLWAFFLLVAPLPYTSPLSVVILTI